MINLDKGELIDLLPPYFSSQAKVKAFSAALRIGMDRMSEYALRTMMYADIDELPEYLLNYIAVELDAQYYSNDMAIDQKREIIKKSLYWKMKAGTKAAVEGLIQTAFGDGSITEWFDFESGEIKPGTFDIITSAVMTPDAVNKFSELIEETKNASSHLRYVEAQHDVEAGFAIAKRAVQDGTQTITDDVHIDNPDQAYIHTAYAATYDFAEGTDYTIVGTRNEIVETERPLYCACVLLPTEEGTLVEVRDNETNMNTTFMQAGALVQDCTTTL